MDNKTTIAIFAIVITAFGIITATSIFETEYNAFAAKYCNTSGCKGDSGYYTEEEHHHCYKGYHDCVESEYHKGH